MPPLFDDLQFCCTFVTYMSLHVNNAALLDNINYDLKKFIQRRSGYQTSRNADV